MRIVLDTSVLVSAFRSSSGASYRLLRLALERRFEILTTTALFLEYEDVLRRPEQRSVHGMSGHEIDVLVRALGLLMVPVEVYFRWRPQLVDSGDEMVLEAAVNGGADLLVTHNVKHFAGVEANFKIRIVRPRVALKELET